MARPGSVVVADRPVEPLSPGAALQTYRVSYLYQLAGTVAERRVVTVRRPFESRLEVRDSRGHLLSAEEASFGRLATEAEGRSGTILSPQPVVATGDDRFGAVVGDALADHLTDRRERRTVAGEQCDVYRFAGADDAGPTTAAAPGARDYTHRCIDARGLLLERRRTRGGIPFEELVATKIEADVVVGDADVRRIVDGQVVPASQGGGSVRQVRIDSAPPTRFFVAPADPAGFARLGRFSVVPPQPALVDPAGRGGAVAGTDDVWVGGGDMIVLDQGGALDGRLVFGPAPGAAHVALGALGDGEVLLGHDGAELRVTLPSHRYVRLYGTVPVARLVDFARALVDTPGGSGIVFAEPR